jgi:hypothetical protein
VPIIGRETERRGREAGSQASADGALLTSQLLEEETMSLLFDEGEMKRRWWRINSLAQRVALVLDAAAAAGIGFGGGGIGREVGDEEGSSWAKLGWVTWRLGPILVRKGVDWKKEWAKLGVGCRKFLSIFLRVLSLKSKVLNTFELNLNWGKIGINSSKLFKGFSIMGLLEIDLNIQIQSKALNGSLLNWFTKRFQNENLNLFEKQKQPRAWK